VQSSCYTYILKPYHRTGVLHRKGWPFSQDSPTDQVPPNYMFGSFWSQVPEVKH
jgi:hypothetical protein